MDSIDILLCEPLCVNYEGKEIIFKPLNMRNFVKLTKGHYDSDISKILEDNCGIIFKNDIEKLVFSKMFLDWQFPEQAEAKKQKTQSTKGNDDSDIMFQVASFVRFYTSYTVEAVLELPFSLFFEMLRQKIRIEAMEDMRALQIADNHLYANSTKNRNKISELYHELQSRITGKKKAVKGLEDLKARFGKGGA